MALYKMDVNAKTLDAVKPDDFATQGITERQLQSVLRQQPDVIDSNILIVGEEFGDFEGANRRIDLLGVDKDGNLAVIELKRGDGGTHMELQAIRYAAMVSGLTFDEVVTIYAKFLGENDETQARQGLTDFLEGNTAISNTPKIILIAPSFPAKL